MSADNVATVAAVKILVNVVFVDYVVVVTVIKIKTVCIYVVVSKLDITVVRTVIIVYNIYVTVVRTIIVNTVLMLDVCNNEMAVVTNIKIIDCHECHLL